MNEIVIQVKAESDVKAGLAETSAEVKAFGDGVEKDLKASGTRGGKSMGSEVASGLNGVLRDLNLPPIDVKADARTAREQLALVEHQVKALRSDDVTIEVKARTNKALLEIERFRSEIADGSEAGEGFISSFVKQLSAGGPEVMGVLGAIAVAAAPVIGATISAGVIGGVGLGGIAGGFALAKNDPAVQAALTGLKANILSEMTNAAQPFVQETLKGIDEIGTAIEHIDFSQIFADSANNVQPIIDGATTAIEALGKSIADIIHNAGPVLKEIGDEVGKLGESVARGLGSLSDNGKQGASALHDLFTVVNGTVDSVFMLINGLTEVYGVLDKISGGGPLKALESISEAWHGVSGKAKETAQAVIDNAKATADAQQQQKGWKDSLDASTAALSAQDDEIHAVANSLKASTDPLFGFLDATDNLAFKEKAAAKATREHGKSSDEARKAQHEYEKSMIAYVSAAASATNGTGHLTQAQRNLLSSAGISKQAIQQLENELHNAWVQANRLDNFDIDINYKQHWSQTGDPSSFYHGLRTGGVVGGMAHGGIKGAASGAMSSGLTWTGEDGPELLDLPPGTAVHTAGDSARMAQQAMAGAGGGGGQPLVVQFNLDGRMVAEAVVDPLRGIVSSRGRGSVQQLLGKPGVH